MNKRKTLSLMNKVMLTILLPILVILLPVGYLQILKVSLNKRVAEPAKLSFDAAIYFDTRYHISLVENPLQLVAYLGERGFVIRNADELQAWMLEKVTAGTADKSVVVMVHGMAPGTILEEASPNALHRKYLDSGGKIVWIGDVPIYYQGHPDGKWTVLGEAGTENILGVGKKAWDLNTKAMITPDGERWGMKIPDLAGRGVPPEDVTTVLSADTANSIAGSWQKNFNPDYPNSGFVRYRANPEYDGANQSLNEDVYQLSIYGFGK